MNVVDDMLPQTNRAGRSRGEKLISFADSESRNDLNLVKLVTDRNFDCYR
jgi:ribosomal protein L13